MKKFLARFCLFLLLPMAACVFVLFQPLDREYAWKSLPDDCDGRGAWIWHRLYADTLPVDIAFLGSSHTIDGIQDTLISSAFDKNGTGKIAANLGYCRFGREMLSVIARDLFTRKKPRYVIIEINEEMTRSSHPVYPYYAQTEDVLAPASFLQSAYPSNVYEAFLARLSQLRFRLFGGQLSDTIPVSSFGYGGWSGAASPDELVPPEPTVPHAPGIWRSLQNRYPAAWTCQLAELCRQNDAQVFFLYIPSFHDQPVPEEGMELYNQLGQVLVPPAELLREKDCWRDPDHLNNKGSERLSNWLTGQLGANSF